MRSTPQLRALFLAAAAALVLTACGGGASSDDPLGALPPNDDVSADCTVDAPDCDDTVDPGDDDATPPTSGMCVEGEPECDDMVEPRDSGAAGGTCPVGTPDCNDTPGNDAGPPPDQGVVAPDIEQVDEFDQEPRIVEPRPGMADPGYVYLQQARVSDDGRSVTVAFWGGVEPCFVVDSVEVEQTDEAVTIGVFSGSDPEAGEDTACIEIAEWMGVQIQLDAPLGERALLDASRA